MCESTLPPPSLSLCFALWGTLRYCESYPGVYLCPSLLSACLANARSEYPDRVRSALRRSRLKGRPRARAAPGKTTLPSHLDDGIR